jgi:hypothetical protein
VHATHDAAHYQETRPESFARPCPHPWIEKLAPKEAAGYETDLSTAF